MRLFFSTDRLLSLIAASPARQAVVGQSGTHPWPLAVEARVPPTPPHDLPEDGGLRPDDLRRPELERLLMLVMVGEFYLLGGTLTPSASGWSPTWQFDSRFEAESQRRVQGASLPCESFTVRRLWWSEPTVVAEWTIAAKHSSPLLIADEVLVEPSGRTITIAGSSVAALEGGLIANVHTYFDDASLIEQVLDGRMLQTPGCNRG